MKKLVLCGVTAGMTAAMVMMVGCSTKDQKLAPPPGQAGILGNREIVPPPFDSPDDLKRLQRPGAVPRMDLQHNLNVLPPEPTLAIDGPGEGRPVASVQPAVGAPQLVDQTSASPYGTGAGQLQTVLPIADLNNGTMAPIVPPPEVTDTNATVSPIYADMRTNARPQGAVDLNDPRQNPSPRPATPKARVPATSKAPVAATGKTYKVKANDTLIGIARRYGITWQDLASLNGLSYQSRLKIGDVLVLPANAKLTAAPAVPPKTASPSSKTVTAPKAQKTVRPTVKKPLPADGVYTVADGDSLWKIAHKYGLKSDDIRAWNSLKSDKLQIGQKLNLKAPEGYKPPTTDKDDKADAKTPENVKAPTTSAKTGNELNQNLHIVVSGDSLWTIARKYKVTTKDLETWNNLKSPNLRIGRALIVKAPVQDGTAEEKPAAPATPAAPAAPAPVATPAPQAIPAQPVIPDKMPLKIPVSMTGTTTDVVNVRDDNGMKLGGATVVDLSSYQTNPAAKTPTTTYIVKAEDTFASLNKSFGWTTEKLKELNPQLKEQDELKAGMEIKVPIDEN